MHIHGSNKSSFESVALEISMVLLIILPDILVALLLKCVLLSFEMIYCVRYCTLIQKFGVSKGFLCF